MNATAESSIEFLAAFECGPMAHYLLTGCQHRSLRKMYIDFLVTRLEAACNHLETIPADLSESVHLERLSTLVYYVTAAGVDSAREREHLQAGLFLLEAILAERGER